MEFADRRVLVTGGTRGIGYSTAQAFLDGGARVAVNGRTKASVSKAIASLGGGSKLVSAPGDISQADVCESVVNAAVDGLGGLDVLVNNAGALFRGSMAVELAPDIRVNCVCPGVIVTDMARAAFAIDGDVEAGLREQQDLYPVGRLGTPEEVATAIPYLASEDAGFINAIALPIEGGATAGG